MLGYSDSGAASDYHQSYPYHPPGPGQRTAHHRRHRHLCDLNQHQCLYHLDTCAASDKRKVRHVTYTI
jgi:hypothetical protein